MVRSSTAPGAAYLHEVRVRARGLPKDDARALVDGVREHVAEILETSGTDEDANERIGDLAPPEQLVADALELRARDGRCRRESVHVRDRVRPAVLVFTATLLCALIPVLWGPVPFLWGLGVVLAVRARMYASRAGLLAMAVPTLSPLILFGVILWMFWAPGTDCRALADGTRLCTQGWSPPQYSFEAVAIAWLVAYVASLVWWWRVAPRGVHVSVDRTADTTGRIRSSGLGPTCAALVLLWGVLGTVVAMALGSPKRLPLEFEPVLREYRWLLLGIGVAVVLVAAILTFAVARARGRNIWRTMLLAYVATLVASALPLGLPDPADGPPSRPGGCSVSGEHVTCWGRATPESHLRDGVPVWFALALAAALVVLLVVTVLVVRRAAAGARRTSGAHMPTRAE